MHPTNCALVKLTISFAVVADHGVQSFKLIVTIGNSIVINSCLGNQLSQPMNKLVCHGTQVKFACTISVVIAYLFVSCMTPKIVHTF